MACHRRFLVLKGITKGITKDLAKGTVEYTERPSCCCLFVLHAKKRSPILKLQFMDRSL